MNFDIKYQKYTLSRLLYNDKSFLIWPRRTGKDFVSNLYLEKYVDDNKNKNILYLTTQKDDHIYNKKIMLQTLEDSVLNNNEKHIYFKNNNTLRFCHISHMYLKRILFNYSPDLIIYNDIESYKNVDMLNSFIDINNIKCIFTTTYLNLDTINKIDINDDFYININLSDDVVIDRTYYDKVINKLHHKTYNLLDCPDASYNRYQKLKKLESKLLNE